MLKRLLSRDLSKVLIPIFFVMFCVISIIVLASPDEFQKRPNIFDDSLEVDFCSNDNLAYEYDESYMYCDTDASANFAHCYFWNTSTSIYVGDINSATFGTELYCENGGGNNEWNISYGFAATPGDCSSVPTWYVITSDEVDVCPFALKWVNVSNITPVTWTNVNNTCWMVQGDKSGGGDDKDLYIDAFHIDVDYTTVQPDTTPPYWELNDTEPDSPITYHVGNRQQFNISWADTDNTVSEVVFEFNNTNYSYLAGDMSKENNVYYLNMTDVGGNADGHVYTWYANDTYNNWNSTVGDIGKYVINLNSTAVSITYSPSNDEYYATVTTVTGINCPSQMSCILRHGSKTIISNPEVKLWGANDDPSVHRFDFNHSGNENYTTQWLSSILTMRKGYVNYTLWFNGTNANRTYNQGDDINITTMANVTEPSVITRLMSNYPGWPSVVQNTSYVLYNVTTLDEDGEWWFNVTNLAFTMNWTQGYSRTLYVTVNPDTTPPIIIWEDPTPDNNEIVSEDWVYLNTTITDAIDTSAFFDWDKTLSGWWAIDWYNSTGIFDNSTYNHFGTYQGALTENNITTGKYGDGFESLGGSGDYINIPDSASSSLDISETLTLETWIYFNSVSTTRAFITKQNAYQLGIYSGEFYWALGGTTPGWAFNTFGYTISTDKWYHIVFTYDKNAGSNNLKYYINGSLVNESTVTGSITINDNNLILLSGDGGNQITGIMDEVRIYDRILSPEEITASFNNDLNRLYHNFTDLAAGDYNYTACAIDKEGNANCTDDRKVTIQAPAANDLSFLLMMPIDYDDNYFVSNGTIESHANTTSWISFNFTNVPENDTQPCVLGSTNCQNNAVQPIFLIDNVGNIDIDIELRINETFPTGIYWSANASCSGCDSTELTKTYLDSTYYTFVSGLSTSGLANITMWADIVSGTTTGEYTSHLFTNSTE